MFNSFVAFIVGLSGQFSCAQSIDHSSHSMDVPTVHGMAILGTDKIYLSHLPMFHTPHDYQVLLEVTLDPVATQVYIKHKNVAPNALYTIVPEVFVLPEMVASPKAFKASIYQGHFERGGDEIISKVTVNITKVVYFKKFNPQEKQPEFSKYILFGDGKEQFAAHLITAKPDFDHLLNVEVPKAIAEQIAQENHVVISVENKDNQKPWETSEVINNEIEVKESIYLEYGDLSH